MCTTKIAIGILGFVLLGSCVVEYKRFQQMILANHEKFVPWFNNNCYFIYCRRCIQLIQFISFISFISFILFIYLLCFCLLTTINWKLEFEMKWQITNLKPTPRWQCQQREPSKLRICVNQYLVYYFDC